jgi:3-methyladenine DNA glycosylase Tag
MRSFEEIQEIAAGRQGGQAALEALLPQPLTPEALGRTHDDRWLSAMTKCLFQAGFNWSAIEARWTGFEAAFDGFDPRKIAVRSEEDIDRLLSDRRIVRNGAKIAAVIGNARLLVDLADKQGSAAAFLAAWPSEDYVGLLRFVEKQGARMGGLTGQRAFREMGRDGFLLSEDVIRRLQVEGVVSHFRNRSKTWKPCSARSTSGRPNRTRA